ncbi:MAG: hypothetical protein ACI9HK_001330 [Pirellulaceae bacterium]|jgi:hypothetical protein
MSNQEPTRVLKRKRLLVALVVAAAVAAAVVACVVAFVASWWLLPSELAVTIGVEGRHLVTLLDEQLEAVPYTHGDALAVRIASAAPIEGGFRYDIRYMAYGPGEHDLNEYLIDRDGRQLSGQPDMTVVVDPLLAEDYSGILFETAARPIDLHSNYRLAMASMWAAWGLLLIPLALYGRRTRGTKVKETPPRSVPDRLRQLLETAECESLCVEQQADLETLLLLFWAERLKVSSRRLAETLAELRKHPAAGAQLSAVERWLHGRQGAVNGSVARELLVELGWRRKDTLRGATQ